MNILFLRFPYESVRGGAEHQTLWLATGLKERLHTVSLLGDCHPLATMFKEIGAETKKLSIGLPPVTFCLAMSFLWRRKIMKQKLIKAIESMLHQPDVLVMLSLTEKILLTEWASKKGMKVLWVEHDRIGRWLIKNPWLKALIRASRFATIVCVSEMSQSKMLTLGFHAKNLVAIPNGIPLPLFPDNTPVQGPSSPDPFSRGEKGGVKNMKFSEEKKAMNPSVRAFARCMRKESTEAETILWASLRNRQLGVKFRRQHPLQSYILDFYCDEYRLGIDLDGAIHDDRSRAFYDTERTKALEEYGIHIIRFSNHEILSDLSSVLVRISEYLYSPLPAGEGLGVRVVPMAEPVVRGERGTQSLVGTLHIGCIARLSPEKGIDVLLRAIADLPEITLTIVGTGREEGYLRSLIFEDAQRIGIQRITLVSHIVDLEKFYQSLDILVLPSLDHDPFGLVAAEAMVHRVATIITDACGIASYLEDGKDVLIAKAGSSESLESAIRSLLDETFRAKIAEEGKITARMCFSLPMMTDAYEQVMKRTT